MEIQLQVEEAAHRLGVRPRTIRAWMYRREIGFTRIGKKAVRIPESEVERIIKAGRTDAIILSR